jgi:hypothetical protein
LARSHATVRDDDFDFNWLENPGANRITAEDRVERIGQLTTRQLTDALLWLAGYAPDVFDVVADAVEPFAGDSSEDPAPFCAVCGGDIGVFLKFGLDWRHYRGTELQFPPGQGPAGVTVSVGIAVTACPNRELVSYYGLADAALYAAKQHGRDAVWIVEAGLEAGLEADDQPRPSSGSVRVGS